MFLLLELNLESTCLEETAITNEVWITQNKPNDTMIKSLRCIHKMAKVFRPLIVPKSHIIFCSKDEYLLRSKRHSVNH